jgi:UDP:flavonoid glycosyltransferase YjiC (YdhE family)
VIEGLEGEELELVITVGPSGDVESFGPQPEHVHIERFIPQAAVLKFCVAAITNGGSGSTVGALASGVPVLTVSSAGAPSQVRNAQAAAAFGAGRVLSRDAVTPEHIRHELRLLTTTKSYTAQAQQIARENSGMPTPVAAASAIANVVRTRQPYKRSD